MEKFDLCVIGSGPSGFAAAMRAIDFGKRVALVERHKVGGAGIFDGALSSKTLWELSESYKMTRNTQLGYTVYDSELSFSSVMNQTHRAVVEKHSQLKQQIAYFQKSGQLQYFQGHGQFKSAKEIDITDAQGQTQTIWADNTVMAIGSRPRYLPHIPIDEKIILTSDGVSRLSDFPKSIVILGAGVIGCEFATIFSNFGKTKVFLIDKEERILPFEDEDISRAVGANMESNGAVIHHGASLEKMSIVNGQVEYVLNYKDGRREIHTVEKALISVGRVANSENLNLQAAGVVLNDKGNIDDEHTQIGRAHV